MKDAKFSIALATLAARTGDFFHSFMPEGNRPRTPHIGGHGRRTRHKPHIPDGHWVMKYNRADLDDTVRIAKKLNKQSYVFATANGYTIGNSPPPANQRYIRIDGQGNMFYHKPTFIVDVVGRI